jgi:hypothetical protein
MKLILAHAILPVRFNNPWIYLGQNYLRMRALEKRLPGKRISMSKLISEESENQRPYTLDWIKRQREANGDSLHWWMTSLAGRANLVSKFFNSIIQIAALRRWVAEQSQEQVDIWVLCEDGFLLCAARDNLKDNTSVSLKTGWWLGWFWDWFFFFTRACYCLIRQVFWFWRHSRIASKTRPDKLDPPQGTVYLIHQCLDDKSFLKESSLACRYFTILPTWLEKQGKQVIRLPWLFNVSIPLDQVYRRLRASNCMIPEDWLNRRDYVRALFEGYKSVFSIRPNIEFDKLDVCALVSRERCQQWGSGFTNARFWRYAPALERWGKSLSKLVMIDTYELQPGEHVQIASWRIQMRITAKFIGYVNSLVSSDYLAYYSPAGEQKSKVFPDMVVTTGSMAQAQLIQQGFPADKLRAGPALRQSLPIQSSPADKASRRGLLLLLSYKVGAVELLHKISQISTWIYNHLDVPVIVKSHPMTSQASILKWMDWETLPEGWLWHDGEIREAMSTTRCTVSLSTSSVVDAVLAGCIPCMLTCAQDVSFNSLDFWANQFPILSNITDDQIQTRLEEIFISRRAFFQSETLKIQEHLIQALNPINDQTLAVFE